MYKRILVPLEHSEYDHAIMEHVRRLAKLCHSSVVLIHVADGFAARNVRQLNLRESEEMRIDREYLEQMCASLEADGIEADCLLAGGDPGKEIADAAAREQCDLIAMSTHGHRFIKDMIYGSVANDVRHLSSIPVLLVRGERRATPRGPTLTVS
jgi:nucleotide-binding universal stress UspA family protein